MLYWFRDYVHQLADKAGIRLADTREVRSLFEDTVENDRRYQTSGNRILRKALCMTNSNQPTSEAHETELWFAATGAAMMRQLEVKSGDRVLDFGCGPGRYVVPLSQVVGPSGRVFAFERDSAAIETTRERLVTSGTSHLVEIVHVDTIDPTHSLANFSIDACFLFDILQYVDDLGILFTALNKALKPKGQLHVYPAAVPHPGSVMMDRVIQELQRVGIYFSERRTLRLMHNVHFLEDAVYSFRKP